MCASTIVVPPRAASLPVSPLNRARFNSTVLLPIDLTSKSPARSRRRVKMSPYAFRDADKSRMGLRLSDIFRRTGLSRHSRYASRAEINPTCIGLPKCLLVRSCASARPSLRRGADGTGSRKEETGNDTSLGLTPERDNATGIMSTMLLIAGSL